MNFRPDEMSASEAKRPTAPARIDLNADLGEGFPSDRALLALVTSASICCGAHAGGPDVIRATLKDAAALGVTIGAHPGYADRDGFGRREQELSATAIVELIVSQVTGLIELGNEAQRMICYIKPHGALYNQAQRDPAVAAGVIKAAQRFGLPLLGLPASVLETEARVARVAYFAEGFPDRRYRGDGSLVARSEPNAVLRDPAEIEAQIVRLVRAGCVDTLCIHGDDPRALANAELARVVLERHGIAVRAFAGVTS
jgi:UPF0271 protein